MSATILLVDDHPLFRQGLYNLLAKDQDLKVIGEASDGLMAIAEVEQKRPDLVIMDINMPNLDGIEATREILKIAPKTRVLALSVHSGRSFVRNMFKAGAAGYLLKESIPEEMLLGIKRVLKGEVFLSSGISDIIIDDYKKLLNATEEPEPNSDPEILLTKLHKPPLSAEIIPRLRLIKKLEDGRTKALTLISSPAGYGKSILASQWLDACNTAWAWLSLDENDNDLQTVLLYLIAAIQRTFPKAELKTRPLLQGGTSLSVKALAHNLLNDFEKLGEPFILVLDDYHSISTTAVHDLFDELLRYPSPNLHLVLLCRRDPRLPISTLRHHNKITEINVTELRLTRAETSDFLARHYRFQIDEQSVSIIDEKIEGWPAGLFLFTFSFKQEKDLLQALQKMKEGSNTFSQDYLVQEVLERTPVSISRMLMATSIVNRFCASLCESLFSRIVEDEEEKPVSSAHEFILWAKKNLLFIIALDDHQEWFRFHHLFQQLLQEQVRHHFSPAEIAQFYTQAGVWFAENNLIEEALQCYLAAGDGRSAAELVRQKRQAVMNSDKLYVLEKWLGYFPATEIDKDPTLLMCKAWILDLNFNLTDLPAVIRLAEKRIDEKTDTSLQGEIHFFRGYLFYFQNDFSKSLKHLQKALQLIPENFHEARGHVELIYGLAEQMNGQRKKALRVIEKILDQQAYAKTIRVSRLQATLVFMHLLDGDLSSAGSICQKLYDFSTLHNYIYAQSWACYLQGLIHFQRNEFTKAINCFELVTNAKFILNVRAAIDNFAGLTYAFEASGQTERAEATLRELSAYAESCNDQEYLQLANSCRIRFAIMRGEQPLPFYGLQEEQGGENHVWWLEVPQLTHCRTLLAEGSAKSLKQARSRLEQIYQVNRDTHNTCQILQALPLLALCCKQLGQSGPALNFLKQAVKMAAPGGWLHPFTELGSPMFELLKQLFRKDPELSYAKTIMAECKDVKPTDGFPSLNNTLPSPAPAQILPDQSLPEPLTNRELDVLELLEKRLQTKEIAEKICVSPETVKSHLKNIYFKLNVNNRRQAVERAQKSGLI